MGCALAIKYGWKCSFRGNRRAGMLCHALSLSALVEGNISDDSHSDGANQRWKVAWAKDKPSCFGYFASLDLALVESVETFEIFFFLRGNLKLCLTPENYVNPVLLSDALWEPILPPCFYRQNCFAQKNCYSCSFRSLARPMSLNYWALSTLPRVGQHYHANMLSIAQCKLSSRGVSCQSHELLVGLGMWKNKLPRAILT